jgi:hypothetical protein
MKYPIPPFQAPTPQDFHFSPAVVHAAQLVVPDAVYQRYRKRVLLDFNLRRQVNLKNLMITLLRQKDFVGAYFHPSPAALEQMFIEPAGQQDASAYLERIELNDWPYQLAMRLAYRSSALPGLSSLDHELVRVAAFIAPAGLLRLWDVVERGGECPLAYMNSRYGHAYSRYALELMSNAALKQFELFDPGTAEVFGQLLIHREPSSNATERVHAQIQRLGAALAWCQVLCREALTQRASMRA